MYRLLHAAVSQQFPKSAKFAKDSVADPPAVLAKGSSSGKGGAGAARVGPLVDEPPPRELARCLGGAGRGGGCLPFFGGKAGVGLSARVVAGTGANGSVPKGSTAAAASAGPGFVAPKAPFPVPNGSKGSFVSATGTTSGAS